MTPTSPIHPDRLSHGEWKGGKLSGEGDVTASYSGDRISEGKPIRTPFTNTILFTEPIMWAGPCCEHGGSLWCCVSISGKGLTASGETELEAYRIVPPAMFNGVATTYGEKVGDGSAGENARNDPLGFY